MYFILGTQSSFEVGGAVFRSLWCWFSAGFVFLVMLCHAFYRLGSGDARMDRGRLILQWRGTGQYSLTQHIWGTWCSLCHFHNSFHSFEYACREGEWLSVRSVCRSSVCSRSVYTQIACQNRLCVTYKYLCRTFHSLIHVLTTHYMHWFINPQRMREGYGTQLCLFVTVFVRFWHSATPANRPSKQV